MIEGKKFLLLMLVPVLAICAVFILADFSRPVADAVAEEMVTEKIDDAILADETEVAPVSILKRAHIVFYTQKTCIYCKKAEEFIRREYPNLSVDYVDIGTDAGYLKLSEAARRMRVRDVGTPFIILGDSEYIMGWGGREESRFRAYVDTLNLHKKQ